jgi:hypothetical protein
MSDELVKRLRDEHLAMTRNEAAAAIEALEAKLDDLQDRLDTANKARAHVMKMAVKKQAKLFKAVEALRDLTNAFAEKVDVDQTRWKTPYEHPLSAYDRAVALLKGDKP